MNRDPINETQSHHKCGKLKLNGAPPSSLPPSSPLLYDRSGTPAEAAARPAAAVAAKAAAESDNVLEEWVDGDPVETHHSRRVGCGLVWFGLVWFDLIWSGLIWFGLAWLGLV